MPTAENIAELRTVLGQPFNAGSQITNCVAHSGRPFDERPDDCKLCATDIKNHLALAIRVNEFLNEKVESAIKLLD